MATPPASVTAIRAQYEQWPYPQVPSLASVPSTHPWELHCSWLWDRCGSGPAPARPRIWLAGCGTMQPYVFGLANPHGEIVATDLSETSLQLARRRTGLRRMRHVTFAWSDLDDPATWPEGRFDLIECYGVLMNLPDPARTLRELGRRLSPRGVLRLMVYPQWSRTRIFQIQRLARLLGLHGGDRRHPRLLRGLLRSLPRRHPLRWAFTTYADARNDAGVVDGFLHAGDRGYTGWQLGELVRGAGLRPAFWFHRPHAQPGLMAERLGLQGRGQDFVLGYLDLWQELRTNFIVCLRRDDAPAPEPAPEAPHPMFGGSHAGWRHRLRLLRLQLLGGALPSRTGPGAVRLSAAEARALGRGAAAAFDDRTRARLRAAGLLLGASAWEQQEPHGAPFAGDAAMLAGPVPLGRCAPNPFYRQLFAAFTLAQDHPELGLPDLEGQTARWGPWADPLEGDGCAFGLTPYGTFQRFRTTILEHLERPGSATAPDLAAVRLRRESVALGEVRSLLARHPDLPQRSFAPAELRELWLLLCSWRDLFVGLE